MLILHCYSKSFYHLIQFPKVYSLKVPQKSFSTTKLAYHLECFIYCYCHVNEIHWSFHFHYSHHFYPSHYGYCFYHKISIISNPFSQVINLNNHLQLLFHLLINDFDLLLKHLPHDVYFDHVLIKESVIEKLLVFDSTITITTVIVTNRLSYS